MYCLGRFFPSWAYDVSASGEKYRVQVDFVEKKKFSDFRVRQMRTLSSSVTSGDAKPLAGSPRVFLLDDTFWILLPEDITVAIQSFVNDAFRYQPLRNAMHLEKLDRDQQLLFESAVVRIALETAIHHELGHIMHGHLRPGDTEFLPFVSRHKAIESTNCSEWTNAKEMAADDYAAQSLTASLIGRKFFTFPAQQELEDAGPFAFMNALFMGVCIYYVIQQRTRLEDIRQEARDQGHTVTDDDAPSSVETRTAAPKCGVPLPCRLGQTRRPAWVCLASGYPTVRVRMRYFFMTLNDSRKQWENTKDGDMSASHKLQVVLKGLGLYLNSLYGKDPKMLGELNNAFTWMSLYNSPDVTWIEKDGMVTLSSADSAALKASQEESDRAEQLVLAEIKPQYDRFKLFEPCWRKLSRKVANAQ